MGDGNDSPAEAPTVEAEATPDSFDEVLRRVVRGPAPGGAPAELAAGTAVAGRFTIERVLGAGGMGTVYSARDQTLARAVAIKLHHAAGGALRLRREAIAMARLAHPNVVTVYEVGELDRRPFVVMEYVAGTTLRGWLAAAPRGTAEILAILCAAGDGLAAAHDAGLVHRDVKPENVLIGTDGRARMSDFGLARELDSDEREPAPDAANQLLRPMTMTGAVLGTPAYMAPEQFDGAPVEARADQFAFCVTAWEALWGERPFSGATLDQLRDAFASGRRRAPTATRKVPARVRVALERGLAVDPEARFPSIHALLAALRAPARRRRRIVAGGAAAVAVAGAIAAIATVRGDHAASCDDAGTRYTGLVPRDLAIKLRAAGATEAAARVEGALSEFVTALDAGARSTCEARHPAELARASDACFAIAAQVARRMLDTGPVARTAVPELVIRATSLPPLDGCSSPSHLAAMRALPEAAAERDAIIAARAELRAAMADRRLRGAPVLDRIARVAPGDPTTAAGLTLLRGLAAIDADDLALARKLESDAYYAARTLDDDELTSDALGHLITYELDHHVDPQAAQMWMRTALADAERFHARSPWLAGQLYVVAARAGDAEQDAALAARYVARARELLPAGTIELIDAAIVEASVALWTGHIPDGIAMYERAIAAKQARLGSDHPEIGVMYSNLAALLLNTGHSEQAVALARRAIAIIGRSPDPMYEALDNARLNLGAVLSESGLDDEARQVLELSRAGFLSRGATGAIDVATVDVNLSLIYTGAGDHDRAIAVLTDALAIFERVLGADRIETAEALFNLAVAHRGKGELARALPYARRCAAIYAVKASGSDRHRSSLTLAAAIENDLASYEAALADTAAVLALPGTPEDPQSIAWPQLERARALIATRRFAEARPLVASSRERYAGLHMQHRVDELDALARKLR